MNDQRRRLGSCELYSIVWIAAIVVELTAARAMLDEEHDPPTDFEKNKADGNKYVWGRIDNHNILIAFLPAGFCGQNNAATTIACFRSSLPHIKFGVLVGIAGAIPRTTVLEDKVYIDKKRDIRLGDVVIGRPGGTSSGVLQYDFGKMLPKKGWERTGSINLPPHDLLSVVQFLESKPDKLSGQMQALINEMIEREPSMKEESQHQGAAHDRLFKADYVHRNEDPDCSGCDPSQEIPRPKRKSTLPAIHYGVILSGNSLVKDAEQRDTIARTTMQDCICYEMEAAAIVSQLPCLPYAAATAAAYARILICNLDPPIQIKKIRSKELALLFDPMFESVKKLEAQNGRIEQSCETVATAAELDVLSRLPISDEARYDSWEEGKSALCLPETRKDIFKQLLEWLEKERSRTFCLKGMTGTGKSTISRSFATDLQARGQLGASFFFKRNDMRRGTAKLFSSTIAADLAGRFSAARASIVDTVNRNERIAHREAKQQFQLLVLDPLAKVQLDKNIAIVIDAVDECDDTDLKTFFSLVSALQRAELPRVKLFFTSRPDLPVLKVYKPLTDEYATMALHEVQRSTIDHDLRIYLKHRLEEVRESYNNSVDQLDKQLGPSWPRREDVDRLLKMSDRLFISAVTMCRSLEEDSMSRPDLQLSGLLKRKTMGGNAFESIYKPVLDHQIPKTYMSNGESPVAVVFSSDSNLFALRNGVDEIEIWNIENGSENFKNKVRSFKVKYDADYFHRPRSFTHNNTCVLIASHHSADFWSIESGQLVGSIKFFPYAAHEVAVSPDCSLLAGHFDDCLIYWNIESGQRIRMTFLPTEKRAPSYDLVLSSNMTAWTITTELTGSQEVYSTDAVGPLAFLQKENNAYTISEEYLIIEPELGTHRERKTRTTELGRE
ncbi:hypothetical protein ACQRIU_003999 [Beauveria bassiana]